MRPTAEYAGLLVIAISFVLSGCGAPQEAASGHNSRNSAVSNTADALEALASESGVISESELRDPAGSYGRSYEGSEDRLCIVPAGNEKARYRVGVEIHIGEEEYCRGAGVVRRAGDLLIFTLGQDGRCTVTAHYDGDQVVMPGAVDQACDSLCSARSSLAGVSFPRLASGGGAGHAVIGKSGDSLCPR